MACPVHETVGGGQQHELVAERSDAEESIIQTTLDEFRAILRDWTGSLVDDLRAAGDGAIAPGSARVFVREALDPYRQSFDVVLRTMWDEGHDQGREDAIQRHNLDISFDLQRDEVRGALRENARRASRHIQSRMTGDLADALEEAHDAGLGIPDITQRLQDDVFPQMQGHEAERVARTEVISSSNKGADQAYTDSSATKKEWIATRDSRTRASHRYSTGVGGQVVPMDEPFRWQNHTAQFPGDPALPPEERVNCRCAHVPVFDEGRLSESSPTTTPPPPAAPTEPSPTRSPPPTPEGVDVILDRDKPEADRIGDLSAHLHDHTSIEDAVDFSGLDEEQARAFGKEVLRLSDDGQLDGLHTLRTTTDTDGDVSWMGKYSIKPDGSNEIILNPGAVSKRSTIPNAGGVYSSTSFDATLTHEAGHLRHHLDSGDEILQRAARTELPNRYAELIENEVGLYAATSPTEFVAETYAGLRKGETYSDEIMGFYSEFTDGKL